MATNTDNETREGRIVETEEIEALPKDLKDVAKRIDRSTSNGAREYNKVYRTASTNLIIVGGLLLAFTTGFITQLQDSPNVLKALVLGVVCALTASLAFGVIQQLMEAQYFRTPAMRKIRVVERVVTKGLLNADRIKGMLDEIDDRPNAVNRWASIVQICLLAVALLGLIACLAIYLFN